MRSPENVADFRPVRSRVEFAEIHKLSAEERENIGLRPATAPKISTSLGSFLRRLSDLAHMIYNSRGEQRAQLVAKFLGSTLKCQFFNSWFFLMSHHERLVIEIFRAN